MADDQAVTHSRNPVGLITSTLPSFTIWALQAAVNYILVEHACASAAIADAIHVINAAAFVLLLILAIVAYRQYKASVAHSSEGEIDAWPPERWMPAAALVLSLAFALVTLAQGIPSYILGRCQ